MDLRKVDNLEFDGIDTKDYPDFVDAYISGADYEGKPMTDEQLETLNENGEFVYDELLNYLF